MSDDRPLRGTGATYFFTVACDERHWLFREPQHVAALCDAFRSVRACDPFETLALVIMPDHLHCVWRLPRDDANFSVRWDWIKRRVANGAPRDAAVWQPRFWEHLIRDESELERHVDYIHFNPVRHGLARAPGDWRYSTFRQHVARGRYALDWDVAADSPVARMSRE